MPLSDGGCRVRGWVKLSHRGNRETWESEAVMMIHGPWGCCSLVDTGSFFIRTINQQVIFGLEHFFLDDGFLAARCFWGLGFLGEEMKWHVVFLPDAGIDVPWVKFG